jgi:kinesin family protein 18/19
VSRATNSLSPPAATNGSPKPLTSMLSPLKENGNENEPPRRFSPSSRLPRSSYGSGSDSELDPLKIRSALQSAKRRERLSLHTTTASNTKRISSVGSTSGAGAGTLAQGHRRASASYSGPTHAASASNGISRHRRGSTERGGKRSPPRPIPITCSPPGSGGKLHHQESSFLGGSGSGAGRNLTQGQARRMNMGGSVRAERERGSPTAVRNGPAVNVGVGADGGVGGQARRITIGTVPGAVGNGGVDGNGHGGPGVLRPRPSMVWR